MKFSAFIKGLIASPVKILVKALLYFAKIMFYCLYWLIVGIAVEFIQNDIIYSIVNVLGAYIFFTVWTYVERIKNSDAETDYTEKLGERRFSFSYEIQDVLRCHKWNLLLETAVFHIVLSLFLPVIVNLDQSANIITVSAAAAYLLQPVFNVFIWVFVRKSWYTRYRRWARRKKTQEFVDTAYADDNEERME